MHELQYLLDNNLTWATEIKAEDPEFFLKLSQQQSPDYLWIGCSDSRVPANDIVGLMPGELFVHRNVGNVVSHSDLNCLSVLQYAVEVLQVKHVIVCGHYGCGGVRAATEDRDMGLIDNWLRGIKSICESHCEELSQVEDPDKRLDLLCELNVRAQVRNLCNTTVVQSAWKRGQELYVHGWIYSIRDGVVRDLEVSVGAASNNPYPGCSRAVQAAGD